MLTKKYVKDLVNSNFDELNEIVHQNINNIKNLVLILDSLGKIPKDFDSSFLLELTKHKNADVRLLAVKNIGKLTNLQYLDMLASMAKNDTDTSVRREAVSSIGRMRSDTAKPYLLDILEDEDPKVVAQAIRGLLVFKNKDEDVVDKLKKLKNHTNEMISSVINKELFPKPKDKNIQPHANSYDYLKNVVVNGDTIEVMKMLEDESVHLTFTSPPYYNARDYSIYPSYKGYLEFLAEVFKEVYRITKDGRFFILNTSPVIVPRFSRAHSSTRYPIPFDIHPYLIDMGWEFIDDIIWLKPEASVKNRIGGFMQHRKPLGYKPNSVTEYLMVYRKSSDKLLDWNMKQYENSVIEGSKVADGYESSNVWKIDPCFDKIHSAVFPTELCKRVIQYYSFQGDLVFDPFGGSGTFGKTAALLNRNFFLTEKDPEYFEYMKNTNTKNGIFKADNEVNFLTLNEFKEWIKQGKL